MTEPVDHDAFTQAGPTELGAAVDVEPLLAYSYETEVLDYPEPVSRVRVALIAVGIVAMAASAVGAVLWLGSAKRGPPAPVAAPSAVQTTTAPPLPPPPTVTTVIVQQPAQTITQAAPPTPSGKPAWLAAYDQRLLNELAAQGIRLKNPDSVTRDAHIVCQHLSNGQSVAAVKQEYATASGGDQVMGEFFVSTVMSIYPSCP